MLSGKVNSLQTSQEFSYLFQNPKVQHTVHCPVCNLKPLLFKYINYSIILQTKYLSYMSSLQFLQQKCLSIFKL
jgi:hypothetical protein